MNVPDLTTARLTIRPFEMRDLDDIRAILDRAFGPTSLEARQQWLQWTVLGGPVQAQLSAPPYGDRAVVLRETGQLIGAVGLVPSYGPFGKLPYFKKRSKEPASGLSTPEVGLFWVLDEAHRGQGYATESADTLAGYMFSERGLKRIVATTEYDNAASIAVMRRIGMRIEHNPDPEPHWFQVVGILENSARL